LAADPYSLYADPDPPLKVLNPAPKAKFCKKNIKLKNLHFLVFSWIFFPNYGVIQFKHLATHPYSEYGF
jgi:hypothetical protein